MVVNNPTVSVIIPTYDRAHLVGRAIQSVLNQIYQDFEIIVVDDGSTDNTEGVVKSFDDKRIRYIRHKENKGGSAARNTGIETARGEYIAFLDSDDEWLPEKLEKQLTIFKKCSRFGLVYCGYQKITDKTKVIRTIVPRHRGNIKDWLLISNCTGPTSTVIVRKKHLDSIEGFDETLKSAQDWDLYIRLSEICLFDYVRRPLVKYHVHDRKISTDPIAFIQGKKKVIRKIREDVENNPFVISYRLFVRGKHFCVKGKLKGARINILKAIKIYHFNIRYWAYLFFILLGFNPIKFFNKINKWKDRILLHL